MTGGLCAPIRSNKSFLLLFFKKDASFPFLQPADFTYQSEWL